MKLTETETSSLGIRVVGKERVMNGKIFEISLDDLDVIFQWNQCATISLFTRTNSETCYI